MKCMPTVYPVTPCKEQSEGTLCYTYTHTNRQTDMYVYVHCIHTWVYTHSYHRVLMDTASSRRDNIVKSVLTIQIKHVVKMEGSLDTLHRLAYLEAVTENFSLGNVYSMFCSRIIVLFYMYT